MSRIYFSFDPNAGARRPGRYEDRLRRIAGTTMNPPLKLAPTLSARPASILAPLTAAAGLAVAAIWRICRIPH